MKKHISAIILAAGLGTRMKSQTTKQQMTLKGQTVLKRTVARFNSAESITDIIIVTRPEEYQFAKEETKDFKKVKKIVSGGKTRAESAKNGFEAVDEKCEYVAIHDGARCFVPVELINRTAMDAVKYGAATVASRIHDAVKAVDENDFITHGIDRDGVRFIGTPQIFSRELYSRALGAVDVVNEPIVDDNILMERIGVKVYCTLSDDFNMKITTPNDFKYAEFILSGENS